MAEEDERTEKKKEIEGASSCRISHSTENPKKEKATMPVFTFSGKTASGEKVQGERVAPTKDGLAAQLRKERITPGSIREKGKEFSMPTFGSGKVKVKEMAVFFRQFSVMIDAGLPLVQCLEILGANQENPNFQKTLLGVRTTVEGGATLANAMRQYPDRLRRLDDQHGGGG